MDIVEQLERERRRMLVGFVVAFGCWQLPAIIEGFAHGTLPEAAETGIAGLALVGALAFIVTMVRLMRLRKRILGHEDAARALDDERVRRARLGAFRFGFAAMLVVTAVLRLLVEGVSMTAAAALQTCLVAGVVATIAAYLHLDRE